MGNNSRTNADMSMLRWSYPDPQLVIIGSAGRSYEALPPCRTLVVDYRTLIAYHSNQWLDGRAAPMISNQ